MVTYYFLKLPFAVVFVLNLATIVIGQNGILECGCFKSDPGTNPNATSFEDSMSGCVSKCDKLDDCIGFGFNDSNGKCQLHTKDTLTLDAESWYNDSSCSPSKVPAEKKMKMYLFQTGSGYTYDCNYLLEKGWISQSGYTTIEVRGHLIAVYCLLAPDDSYALTYMDVGGWAVDSVEGTFTPNRLKLDVNACVLNVNTTDISQSDSPDSGIEIGDVSPCSGSRDQTLDFTLTPFRFIKGWFEQVVVDTASPSAETPAGFEVNWQQINSTYNVGCSDKRYILTNLNLVKDHAYVPLIPMVFNTR